MNLLRRIASRLDVGKFASPREYGPLSVEEAIVAGVLIIGAHSYGMPTIRRFQGDTATVQIGKYCSLADGSVFMVGGNHRTDWITTYPLRIMLGLPGALTDGHPTSKGDIIVGNDVWIGADARILSGVEIGDGAVIGASSVVATDVRPYAIFAGNPAREIRRRFSDRTVEELRRTAWWDWPDELVRDRVEYLCDPHVEAFLTRFGGA
jgi:acetyltransferase-like isoleucine patch superfamily enzyme